MFTEQMQELDRLKGHLPDEAIEILKQTLGNCMQSLTHRGQVSLETDGDQRGYPDRPVMPSCGDVGATLHVKNPASYASIVNEGDANENLNINNGAALQVCGIACFTPTEFGPDNNIYNNITNITTGIHVTNIVRFGDTDIYIDGTWDGPFGQIYVSSNDTTLGYLNGKAVAGSLITLAEVNDGGDETLVWSVSQYNAPTDGYVASYHAGTQKIRWIEATATPGADIYVKVNSGDTADYLVNQMRDLDTYVSSQDGLIKAQVVTHGSDGTDSLRFFLDSSIISSFSAGSIQLLGHDASGNLKWYNVSSC